MRINAKTALFIVAGLGLLWMGRKVGKAASAIPARRQTYGMDDGLNGFDGAGRAKNPLGRPVGRGIYGRPMGRGIYGRVMARRGVTLPLPVSPARPWYADAGANAPTDPYRLPPVSACGDAINTRAQDAFSSDDVGQVEVADHGMVSEQAETVPYIEPGDALYGSPSEIDYGDAESGAEYDDQPGALLGAH